MSKRAEIVIKIIMALLVAWAISILCSCNFLHKMQATATDSTVLAKKDSTHVQHSENKNTNENTWFKEWIQLGGHRDSFVQKEIQLQPINNTQPVIIYREGGTNKQEQWHFNYDSFAKAVVDSAASTSSHKETETKQDFLSGGNLILVIAGIVLFFWLFVPKPSFSFNKK